jgi:hypothetical protein
MKKLHNAIMAVAALTMLSACGDRPGERALSGGAIGAGAGAVDVTEEMREKMAYLLNSISKPGLHGVGRDSHGCIFRT